MITLITGQPGDGKTLYTITAVKAQSEKEQRPVFYSGIPDLRLPWVELEAPEKWYECPTGAIIVIDEAQRIFRPRGNGAPVPRHVAELETHRHRGHDLFIITQQPMLVDSNVRRLVGRHLHAKRKFGAPASTVHEWSQVRERPDQNRSESIRHEFIFPKSTYALYKSAEVHTHKLRIPLRVWALCVLPLIFAGVVYGAVRWFQGRVEPRTPAAIQSPVLAQGGNRTSGEVRPAPARSEVGEWIHAHQPRLPGMPFTAPKYDAQTKPTQVPYPAACIATKTRCQCYTQQATLLDVSQFDCRQIVARGYFLDFDPGRPPRGGDGPGPAVYRGDSYVSPAKPDGDSEPAPVALPDRDAAARGGPQSGFDWGSEGEVWHRDTRQPKPFLGPFVGQGG